MHLPPPYVEGGEQSTDLMSQQSTPRTSSAAKTGSGEARRAQDAPAGSRSQATARAARRSPPPPLCPLVRHLERAHSTSRRTRNGDGGWRGWGVFTSSRGNQGCFHASFSSLLVSSEDKPEYTAGGDGGGSGEANGSKGGEQVRNLAHGAFLRRNPERPVGFTPTRACMHACMHACRHVCIYGFELGEWVGAPVRGVAADRG